MHGRFWIAVVVFVISFGVYRSNVGNLYTYDSAPASLFALNAMEHQTLAFDDFRGGYFTRLGGGYAFVEAPNGHLEPLFPIGTALLAAPFYGALYGIQSIRGSAPDITDSAFEPIRLRDEKRVANGLAALAAALFFLCALRISALVPALVSTAAFAFGTSMWTIGSQALWQHGSIALVTLAMIAALLANDRWKDVAFAFVAGACAGFLPVIRPTAIAYSLVGFAFVFPHEVRRRWAFVLGAVVGVVPGVLWNELVFGTLIGGYASNLTSYEFSFSQVAQAFSGLLVSPNRGVLIFTPLVLIAIAGAVRAFRSAGSEARILRYLTLASTLTFANYVFFVRWQGGGTYGARYLTDCMPTVGLVFAFAIAPAISRTAVRDRALLAVGATIVAFSMFVQFVGANGEPKTNWSGIPVDSSIVTERIWDWHDVQIVRDARATRYLFTSNPTFSTEYANGFNGMLGSFTTASTDHAIPRIPIGTKTSMSIPVANTGASRWYGYESGIYFGQVRVRARFFSAAGNDVYEDYLYVKGSPRRGESSIAIGSLSYPSAVGRYRVIFDIDVFQDARIGSRHLGARTWSIDIIP